MWPRLCGELDEALWKSGACPGSAAATWGRWRPCSPHDGGASVDKARAQARIQRYVASNDPDFEKKVADIIGLYLNPPAARAPIFCVDEQMHIQARPGGSLAGTPPTRLSAAHPNVRLLGQPGGALVRFDHQPGDPGMVV